MELRLSMDEDNAPPPSVTMLEAISLLEKVTYVAGNNSDNLADLEPLVLALERAWPFHGCRSYACSVTAWRTPDRTVC